MALNKYCRCGKQIPIQNKCCDDCIGYYQKQNAKYQKKYDSTKRVNADFYESLEWKSIREVVITKANGLDLYEYYINKAIVKANTVHHIIEVKEDYELRLDITNLIPLSASNHKKIHKKYLRNKRATQQMLMMVLEQARQSGIAYNKSDAI